jgi:hypothetical protein
MYVPSAAVDHHVSADRVRLGYFLRRCWHEGRSKAEVVRLAGATSGLERERRQVAAVIPAAVLRDMRDVARGRLGAISRICAALGGVAAAAAGYLAQRARQAWQRVRWPGAQSAAAIAQANPVSNHSDA